MSAERICRLILAAVLALHGGALIVIAVIQRFNP